MITLTTDEALSICDFIELYYIQSIHNNEDVNNMQYVYNISNIWKKCKDEITPKDDSEAKGVDVHGF
jgi:hypothetical protein